jgi:uncharacterized phage-like protein YoqJ
MKTTITFCGHREVVDEETVLKKLTACLEPFFNVESNRIGGLLLFYCGGCGAFDRLAAQAIDILRKKYPNIAVEKIFVTPYITISYQETINLMKEFYDEVIYPSLENVPPKYAISHRNQWMVDQSDYVIAYITHGWGGAAKTLTYAKRKHKQIISISD